MSDLNLFNYYRSSTSYRVRIALEIKKLNYTYTPIHLLNNGGEQNSAQYREINPMGGVPALKHGDNVIAQSFAIIEYLEDTFPTSTKVFPADPFLRAKVRQFCETINADIHPLQNLKVMQYLEKVKKFNTDDKQQWLNKWISEGLLALEKIIEPYAKDFCFGDSLTAADIFLIPQLFSSQRFNVPIEQFKILSRINTNCLALEPFKKAHPHQQPDTPPELQNK